VIAHAELRPVGVGPELTHAAGGEVRAVGIVDAQIQGIVVDECEEELIAVQARAAEHAPRAHPAQAAELIVNVVEVLAADGHESWRSRLRSEEHTSELQSRE